jgi:hypothetical protein
MKNSAVECYPSPLQFDSKTPSFVKRINIMLSSGELTGNTDESHSQRKRDTPNLSVLPTMQNPKLLNQFAKLLDVKGVKYERISCSGYRHNNRKIKLPYYAADCIAGGYLLLSCEITCGGKQRVLVNIQHPLHTLKFSTSFECVDAEDLYTMLYKHNLAPCPCDLRGFTPPSGVVWDICEKHGKEVKDV